MTAGLEPLEYVEDFRQAWATWPAADQIRMERQASQLEAEGRARGGPACCGTTSAWHRPWCHTGPRRYRDPEGVQQT